VPAPPITDLVEVSKGLRLPGLVSLEMCAASRLVHGLGYLVNALGSQRLIADQLILHLPALLGTFDLPLGLLVVLRAGASCQDR
jgi:hypothetical protein